MSIAVVFPGQGAQSVGMLARLLAEEPAAKRTFEEASELLGYDLGRLVTCGPEDLLNRTDYSQPAMLATGVAVWRVWRERGGPDPIAMSGHSLGEYTALVCAGALDFGDGVRVVRLRGEQMQRAVPEGQGAMAAVLGLDDDAVIAACAEAEAQGGVVEAVNFNAPGQVVIAGDSAAVARAGELARIAGAKRILHLNISAPSHCRLMDPVGEQLAATLAEVQIQPPSFPVYHNIDARPRQDPDRIREALADQVRRPVRWVDCMLAMRSAGARIMIEAGPGHVLCGLARRIDRELLALPVVDPDTLEAALDAVKGGLT